MCSVRIHVGRCEIAGIFVEILVQNVRARLRDITASVKTYVQNHLPPVLTAVLGHVILPNPVSLAGSLARPAATTANVRRNALTLVLRVLRSAGGVAFIVKIFAIFPAQFPAIWSLAINAVRKP